MVIVTIHLSSDEHIPSEFELVDVSKQLPQLIRRPGLATWTPTIDRNVNTCFGSYDAYILSLPEDKRADTKLLETHWPPSNIDTLHLERWQVFIFFLNARLVMNGRRTLVSAYTHIFKTRVDFLLLCSNAKPVTTHSTLHKFRKFLITRACCFRYIHSFTQENAWRKTQTHQVMPRRQRK